MKYKKNNSKNQTDFAQLRVPWTGPWRIHLGYLQYSSSIYPKNHGLRQWVSDDIPYMKFGKLKKMFETTNQII